ncbi:MAG: InlB B-repeat-containing protein [Anaeroplasmataceae bacterium]|nr:InlB B-repeat-containing protein [Anaeroplasmataceae bacterium]
MKFKKILLGCGVVFTALGLFACSTNEKQEPSETLVYTTEFNSNGGSSVQAQTNHKGEKLTKPEDPIKEGHAFSGWYKDEDYDHEWRFLTDVVIENSTLYAKWEINTYIVSFVANGGTSVASQSVEYNQRASRPISPTKEGYIFVGWYKSNQLQHEFDFVNTLITENITLHAKWEEESKDPEKLRVIFNTKDGSTIPSYENVALGSKINPPADPVREGYTFLGWYKDEDGPLTDKFNFDEEVITQSITLFARWDINMYTITFDSNGGSSVESQSVGYKHKAQRPVSPTREGYIFVGWFTESSFIHEFDFVNTEITGNMTLYAKWVERSTDPTKVKVIFNSKGGSLVPELTNVEVGTKISKPQDPVREGYTFLGWFKDEDGPLTGKFNFEEEVITEGITLFARWDIKTNVVTFHTNGGSTIASQRVEYNGLVKRPENPVKEGHIFVAWYKDESLEIIWRFAEDTIMEDIILYAKWEEAVVVPPVEEFFSIYFNTNGKGEQPDYIDRATALPEVLPVLVDENYAFVGWYLDKEFQIRAKEGMILTEDVTLYAKWAEKDSIIIDKAEGYLEGAYIEWKALDGCEDYTVYYKKAGESDSTYKKIDQQLIRQYPNKYRADLVGLTKGAYTIKLLPVYNGQEFGVGTTESVMVEAHVRSGYGFVNGTSSGAYNEDGTLKEDAKVLYITQTTKDTIQMDLSGLNQKGLQNILNGYKKGGSTPLCIRLIGNITDFSVMEKGDLLIDGLTQGVTIEGIGEDATANGWGLRIKGSSNVEVRNLGFMNCNSSETDDVGLQQDNHHIWVHNCDFFYGDAGSDKDQVKGDGALDTKKSTYVTHSYNHFWDTGKTNLQGMKSETTENYITYHHNWYDHSDSRHPRIRTCTVHIYNNYFDGNAKYGVGVTMGSSTFVENNYFRNCNNPMLSSGQGTDAMGEGTFSGETGGIIKAYGNYIEGGKPVVYYQDNATSFDAYRASSRDEKVPTAIKTVSGGTSYNNFDTASGFYSYEIDSPEMARQKVMKYAGRVGGGDFKWTFDNEVEDTNYLVIQPLKDALVRYNSTLVRVLGIEGSIGGEQNPGGGEETPDNPGGDTPVVTEGIVHNFTTSGIESTAFNITGNLSSSKGSITYKELNLTQCLKMESSTVISFTTQEEMTLMLVFKEANIKVKIDDVNQTTDSNGILTIILQAGTHTIKKTDQGSLFYMELGTAK